MTIRSVLHSDEAQLLNALLCFNSTIAQINLGMRSHARVRARARASCDLCSCCFTVNKEDVNFRVEMTIRCDKTPSKRSSESTCCRESTRVIVEITRGSRFVQTYNNIHTLGERILITRNTSLLTRGDYGIGMASCALDTAITSLTVPNVTYANQTCGLFRITIN